MSSNVRVLVADDELPIREGLRMFDWLRYGYELVGEARHGREALQLYEKLKPQIYAFNTQRCWKQNG